MNTARFARSLLAVTASLLAAPFPASAMPPEPERVQETLMHSPRHAEWATIERPDGAPIRAWVVYPERAGLAPVVIVIHEIFGLTDWIRGVTDALAAEGYIAVAPDLLSGMGPGGGGTESFEGDAVRDAIRALTNDETATRLDAVREWALALPAAKNATGVVGFCWGGSAAFAYAAAQPGLGASVVFYGTAPTDDDALSRIECPVLGLYGGDDARVTSTVARTAASMEASGKRFTHHTYEGAGHAFLRQPHGRDGANLRAAEQSWEATLRFLRETLE